MENTMLKKCLIVSASLALASSAFAQGTKSPGGREGVPGHQMQDAAKSTTPGASEHAPGHQMQDANKSTAPGASEHAPGHQTTTGSTTTTKK
jgi:hypothetical protein